MQKVEGEGGLGVYGVLCRGTVVALIHPTVRVGSNGSWKGQSRDFQDPCGPVRQGVRIWWSRLPCLTGTSVGGRVTECGTTFVVQKVTTNNLFKGKSKVFCVQVRCSTVPDIKHRSGVVTSSYM